MADRIKQGFYLHPDDPADVKCREVIESVSQRVRGDFIRQVSGWKPSEADIGGVVKAAVKASGHAAAPAEDIPDTKPEAETPRVPNPVRANMNNMFGKK